VAEESNNIKVVKENNNDTEDVTNIELLITSESREEIIEYDKQRIIDSLVKETGMARSTANQIAAKVDKEILSHNYDTVSTSFIRELVQLELRRRGFSKKVEEYDNVVFPIFNIENIISSLSSNNHNPLHIDNTISSYVLKNFSLKRIFSLEIRDAHLAGRIHLHGLGCPLCLYQGITNIDHIKQNGLSIFGEDFSDKEVKDFNSLLNLIIRFIDSFQSYFIGAVGLSYVNVFLAPFITEEADISVQQKIANFLFSLKKLVLNGNKNSFVEFGLTMEVPDVLKNVPAVGIGGRYVVIIEKKNKDGEIYQEKKAVLDKIIKGNRWKPRYIQILQEQEEDEIVNIRLATYSDFKQEAIKIAQIMLEQNSIDNINVNFLPNFKFILSLNVDQIDKIDKQIFGILSKSINVDFIFDKNKPKSLRQPCGLSFDTKGTNKFSNISHTLHDSIFHHVTINLPQCVYRTEDNITKVSVMKQISEILSIAVEAHHQKVRYIKSLTNLKTIDNFVNQDGIFQILNLEKPTCSIGFVGLEELLAVLLPCEENKNLEDLRLEIISHIYITLNQLSESSGINLVIEESISESVNMRFCKIDIRNYGLAKSIIQGDKRTNKIYYTDSIHIKYSSSLGLWDRVQIESLKHSIVKGHLNLLLFVKNINQDSLMNFIKKVCEESPCESLSLAQNFLICSDCFHVFNEDISECPHCTSVNRGVLAHDGYLYSLVSNWNETKLGEFEDRIFLSLE